MLKIQPNPTFKAKVGIPVPGQAKDAQIEVEFKYMTREEWQDFLKVRGESMTDDDAAREVVVGWSGVDEAFSLDALSTLLKFYPMAATAIAEVYLRELFKAKQGN